jgi:tetratricopeptide (TPR) repeat protein
LFRVGIAALLVGLVSAPVILWRRDPIRIRRNALARGDKYYAQKKFPEAIIEYRTALQVAPRLGEAHAKLADAYAQIDDARNAFIEYVTTADLLPKDTAAQLRAGSALMLMGFAKEAGDRADKVLAVDPQNLDARILRANVSAGLKNLDDAVAQMYAVAESVADRPSDQARALLHLGVMELARGHKYDAEGILRKASSGESASTTSHLALANYYWAQGRHDEAEVELKRVIAIDPHEPRANRALSALYIATERVPAAEEPLKVLAASGTEPGARFVLADYYIVTKRIGEATSMLNEMSRDTAFFAQAQVRLALIEYEAGRAAQADRIIDATLRKEPRHPTVLLMKARLLAERQQFDEALQRVNAALAVESKSVEAQFLRGSILTAKNDPVEAISAFNRVLMVRPNLVDALVRLSTLHLARSDPDTAARFAVQAVTNAPRNGAARIALVRALLARGNIDEAERELKPLIDANSQSAVVVTQWGRLLALKHDAAGAREFLREAIRLDRSSMEPLTELVSVEIAAGRPADAMPLVEERLANTAAAAPAWLLAARIYAVTRQPAKEEQALKRVIEIEPSNLRAFGALGQFYYATGRIPDARRQFEELARQRPTSVGAFTMLAMIQEMDGKPADAEKTYEHALAIDANAAVAANNLAWLQLRRGANLDVALQLAKTAKAAFPNEPEFNDTVGWIYVQKKLPELGLASLLDSVRAVPDNADFRFHLGMAYVARADVRLARVHLERALFLRQDFEGAGEAKRQLEWLRQLPTDAPSDPKGTGPSQLSRN